MARAPILPLAMASATKALLLRCLRRRRYPQMFVAVVSGEISIMPLLLSREPELFHELRLRGLSDGGDDRVDGHDEFGPSTGTGRGLPLSSGAPSSMRRHSIPERRPFFAINRFGAARKSSLDPFASTAATSSARAGISRARAAVDDRHVFAPERLACPGAINGRISASDHSHLLADFDFFAEVDAPEEAYPLHHTRKRPLLRHQGACRHGRPTAMKDRLVTLF